MKNRIISLDKMRPVLVIVSILLPLIAYGFDQTISIQNHLIRCLFDNFGHGMIALLIWAPNAGIGTSIFTLSFFKYFDFLRRFSQFFEMLLSFIFGCILDVDHFIAGGAFTLKAATSLRSRPFGHSLLFILLTSAFIGYLTSSTRLALLVFVSTLSHQLRDSTRRGMWLWPFGHTPPLPYPLYLLLLAILPFLVQTLLERLINNNKTDGSLCPLESGERSSEERILHIV